MTLLKGFINICEEFVRLQVVPMEKLGDDSKRFVEAVVGQPFLMEGFRFKVTQNDIGHTSM